MATTPDSPEKAATASTAAPAADLDSAPKKPAGKRRTGRIVVGIVGALLVVLAALWVLAYQSAKGKVPQNATVNGVAVGGLSEDEAQTKLRETFEPAAAQPLVMTAGDATAQVTPADAGLSIDYEQTVHATGAGASWNPVDLVRVLTGGGETELVTKVDQEKATAALGAVAPAFAKDPKDALVELADGAIKRTPMTVGTALSVEPTQASLIDAWKQNTLAQTTAPVAVAPTIAQTEPAITDAEADAFVTTELDPRLKPIKLAGGDKVSEITPAMIATGLTITPADGNLTLATDIAKITESAKPALDQLAVAKAKDARIELAGGQPTVVPSVNGKEVVPEDFTKAVEPALIAPEPREVKVEVKDVPAKFTTEDAQKLGVKEVVGEFTTTFPASAYRNTNLGLAAAGINNTFIKPGETFSLAKATGPRNASTGYVEGAVLVGDHLENVVGGGVSQVATTTYNAGFFAGMTDVEHHPHTQYFSRYPAGREATVYEGVLDLQFRNDTPYGVLMEAFIVPSIPGEGSITVKVWSTKYYDSVTASDPVISNKTSAPPQTSTSDKCVPQGASDGFDVSYQRHLTRAGQTTVQDYFWRYSAVPEIRCS